MTLEIEREDALLWTARSFVYRFLLEHEVPPSVEEAWMPPLTPYRVQKELCGVGGGASRCQSQQLAGWLLM